MRVVHYLKAENSGLMRTALEIAHHEELLGHQIAIKEPSTGKLLYGTNGEVDIHCVHHQLHPSAYHDGKTKIMWCHGEPLSSVGNKVSMKAIVDMCPLVDAFICMRKDEYPIWRSIKRATYLVPKGVDLAVYKPTPVEKKLAGSPAVLYCENWRGERNPLMLCIAMQEVVKKLPDAKLHLFNVQDQRMLDTFRALYKHCHWYPWLHTIRGPESNVIELYNRADIVASCLFPLFARTPVEALACGRAVVAPGYRDTDYPYNCELHPESMASAIVKVWEEWGKFDFRKHAETNHDVAESTRQAIAIYEKHL